MFLIFVRNIYVRNKCFPVCAAWTQNKCCVSRSFAHPRNFMSNNVSSFVTTFRGLSQYLGGHGDSYFFVVPRSRQMFILSLSFIYRAQNLPSSLFITNVLFIEIFGVQLESWKNVLTWNSLDVSAPISGQSFIQKLDLPRRQNLEYIGRRMRAYFLAPESGDYIFYITCDDKCKLNLSTDEKLENLVTLVTITKYTRYRAWTRYAYQIHFIMIYVQG